MAGGCETLPKMSMMTFFPHGHRTVNALPSRLIGLGTVKIYVKNADGGQPRRLTNNRHDDAHLTWYNPAFAVDPAGKILTMWGWLKQGDR